MALGNLKVTLNLVADQYLAGLNAAQREAQTFSNKFKPLQKTIGDFGGAMRSVGVGMTAAITVPLAAAGGLIVKTGIDFESAFAGVRKTVNATEPELAKIRDQFRDMAKEMPTTAVELAKIGEAAGQLGIETKDIAAFTKQMAMLGETTNLTSDEAATATAKFQNIFGAAGQEVDRFASALVALGNAGASTEKDIIDMGLRIAGAANVVGLTQAQTLGFASALSSVGLEADLGGSAISRTFLKMNDAVLKGGQSLKDFADIAGVPADKFRETFDRDPGEAMIQFLEGVGNAGKGANQVLEGVVGKNIGLKTALFNAAGAAGEMRAQVELGTKAWQDNSAAQDEYKKRLETTASQLRILQGQLTDIGIELFDALKPIITETVIPGMRSLVGVIAELAEGFTALPKPVQAATIGILGLAAVVGPALAGIGFMLQGIAGLIPVFTKLVSLIAGAGGVSGVIAGMGGAFQTVGFMLAGTAAGLTAATAGVIALGAAIGYLVGSIANWAIEAAGLQPALDANLKSMVEIIPFFGKKITGQANVDEANAGLAKAQAEVVARARSKGIDVDIARLNSDPLYLGAVAKQIQAQNNFKMGDTVRLGPAAAAAGAPRPKLPPLPKIDTEAEREAKQAAQEYERFRQSVLELKQSLTDTTPPSKVLVTTILELEAAGLLTSEAMLRLAKDTDTLKNSEDARIQQIVKSIPFLEMANNALQIQADILKAIDDTTKSRPEFDQSGFLKLPEMAHPELLPEGDIRGGMIKRRADEAVQSLDDQKQELRDLGDTIVELNSRNMSATEIEDALGISLERVAERARELNEELDPMIETMGRVAMVSESWGESFGSIVDQAVDMIVDLDFSFKRLGDIAKNTAKDMARSFLDGFFKPFRDKMVGIGKDAGDWAAGLLFGAKKVKDGEEEEGGLLSGIMGGGLLGGLFGGGDKYSRNPLPGAEGIGGMFGSKVSGLMSALNPISAGLGIANSAFDLGSKITGKIGAGRDSANEIVKLQNAFVNQTLAGILADPNLSATNKMKLVGNEFDIFQQGLNSYAASGGENAVTANQALASVSPLVSNINRDLIAAGATDATGAGGGFTHNGDVIVNAVLPNVHTPEQFLDWYDKNKAGIRIRIAEGTFAIEGAVVTR